jgi:hypothetical protein
VTIITVFFTSFLYFVLSWLALHVLRLEEARKERERERTIMSIDFVYCEREREREGRVGMKKEDV